VAPGNILDVPMEIYQAFMVQRRKFLVQQYASMYKEYDELSLSAAYETALTKAVIRSLKY
jgi:hypothetical protein